MAMRSEKKLVMYKLWFVPPKPFYSIHVNYDAKVVEAARKKIEMRKKKKGEKQEEKKGGGEGGEGYTHVQEYQRKVNKLQPSDVS